MILLGLDFGSPNLGCSALAHSFVYILQQICESEKICMDLVSINYHPYNFADNNINIRNLNISLKKLSFHIAVLNEMKTADFVFDFTGGDSFTDLYGLGRFIKESYFKQLAIQMNKKFIMGPQTIGPFNTWLGRSWAKRILKHSYMVFTRDNLSYEYVVKKMGCKPELTTDIAFFLPCAENQIAEQFDQPRIGINVSGLMWNGGYKKNNDFGLVLNYQAYCKSLIEYCLTENLEVHLIAHVIPDEEKSLENDYTINQLLAKQYKNIIVAPRFDNPMQAKAYMAKMDFFVGSRMHATIGAFSMGVPTVSVAYSRKFMGLYRSIKYPYVIDAKEKKCDEAFELTTKWLLEREEIKAHVSESLVYVEKRKKVFLDKLKRLIL